jgi:hypothetical protein
MATERESKFCAEQHPDDPIGQLACEAAFAIGGEIAPERFEGRTFGPVTFDLPEVKEAPEPEPEPKTEIVIGFPWWAIPVAIVGGVALIYAIVKT